MSAWNNKHVLLVRRELWEHRALWMAPAILGVVMLVVVLLGGTLHFNTGGGASQSGVRPGEVPSVVPLVFGQAAMIGVTMTLGGVACIAIFAYLLDCLYAERKDRSILFWKSLPVSDAQTVLAKLVLALLLVPLLTLLLAVIVQPLLLATMQLRFENLRPAISVESFWGGLQTLPHVAMAWFFGALWYAPFIGYLMLASVLARRVPLMYALMPPGALILLEGLLMGSNEVAKFLGQRLAPWTRDDWAWNFSQDGGLLVGLGSPDWSVIFLNASLWLGLAAAAGMVYIVIRLRRYRDDT